MNALYNDTEPFVCSWLTNLIAGGKIADGRVDARSIEDITEADLRGVHQFHAFAGIGGWSLALRRAGVPDDFPIWTGSCPCQPFSSAGKGLGVRDSRHLWPAWFALIQQCRPPVIFGEQVASEDGLAWLDLVFADLERCGYTVGAADLCAAGVGAPHNRSRLYFVAYTREGGRALLSATWLHDLRQPGHDASGRSSDGDVGDAASGPGRRRVHAGQGEADLGREPAGSRGERDVATGARRDLGDTEGQRRAARRGSGASESRARHAPGGSGAAGALADAAEVRREDPREPREERAGRRVSAGGGALGHAGGDGDLQHVGLVHRDEGEHEVRAQIGYHAPIAPGAVGGFWSDAEWVLCRDPDGPRWRPVKPGSFVLAPGVPPRVVCVCTGCEVQTVIDEELRAMRGPIRRMPEPTVESESAQVLQPEMLRSRTATRAKNASKRKASSASVLSGGSLLKVWQYAGCSTAPPGRERDEQRTRQHRHPLSSVSQPNASAPTGDVDMRRLWDGVLGEVSSQARQDLFCPVCQRVGAHLCQATQGGRVGLLRGYGNSINIEVAIEFICASVEAIVQEARS